MLKGIGVRIDIRNFPLRNDMLEEVGKTIPVSSQSLDKLLYSQERIEH
jgi:hypothetical protein